MRSALTFYGISHHHLPGVGIEEEGADQQVQEEGVGSCVSLSSKLLMVGQYGNLAKSIHKKSSFESVTIRQW